MKYEHYEEIERDFCNAHCNDRRFNMSMPKPKPKPKQIYIVGSLRNPMIEFTAQFLRRQFPNTVIFDDWYAAGPNADDHWRDYEIAKGNNFIQALNGAAAKNVYEFDKRNIDASDAVVLVLPAGKSGHLELGYAAGKGKQTYILLDADPERFDVMYQFATGVVPDADTLADKLKEAGY